MQEHTWKIFISDVIENLDCLLKNSRQVWFKWLWNLVKGELLISGDDSESKVH